MDVHVGNASCYGRTATVWVLTLNAYESVSQGLFPLLLHGASVRKRRHRGGLSSTLTTTFTFGWLCCSLRQRSMAAVPSAAITRRPPMAMPAIAPPDSSSSFTLTADDSSRSGVETDRCGGGARREGATREGECVGGWPTGTPRTAVASSAVASFVSSLAAMAIAVVARSSLATAGGVMETWSFGQQLTQNVSAISAKARGELWGQGIVAM